MEFYYLTRPSIVYLTWENSLSSFPDTNFCKNFVKVSLYYSKGNSIKPGTHSTDVREKYYEIINGKHT